MNIKSTNEELSAINEYLSKHEWMDFEFRFKDNGAIELYGDIDKYFAHYESIVIEFIQPKHINGTLCHIPFSKGKPFIELVSESEAKKSIGIRINEGEYIFKINADDDVPAWVVSKSIKCNILKPHK